MSDLPFVEHPTLQDLNAFAFEMRRLSAAIGTVRLAADAERKPSRRQALLDEMDGLINERLRLEMTHHMQAHDYREYLKPGLELPPHRRALYEANANANP